MRFNSSQKAQQALEELARAGEYTDRLRTAFGHLIIAGSPEYAEDSIEIDEAFRKASDAFDRKDWSALETGIREMIQAIFEEEGANRVRSQMG